MEKQKKAAERSKGQEQEGQKQRIKLTIQQLIEKLEEEVDDPRRDSGNIRHKLVDILVIVLIGIVCGCETWQDIEDYANANEEWLREYLELPNGIPSDDTYRRVFERVKPEQLEAAYRSWVLPYIGACWGKHVAIDGKTVCGASKQIEGDNLHIVSAWVREDAMSLGQIRTAEKSNEITAIPKLLEMLNVRGAYVTIDAMGCQTAIAEKIVKEEAFYVLAVKKNQSDLYEAVEEYFNWAVDDPVEKGQLSVWREEDHTHGRHCKRKVEVTNEANWYTSKKEWEQLTSMIRVTRTCERKGKVSREQAYYISNAALDAQRFAQLIRGHWSIENQLHWSLDVVFHEDHALAHTAYSPQNLSVVRKIAKALLQNEKSFKASVPRKSKRASYMPEYARTVVGFHPLDNVK